MHKEFERGGDGGIFITILNNIETFSSNLLRSLSSKHRLQCIKRLQREGMGAFLLQY